jgi:hypothetical protein
MFCFFYLATAQADGDVFDQFFRYIEVKNKVIEPHLLRLAEAGGTPRQPKREERSLLLAALPAELCEALTTSATRRKVDWAQRG